MANRRKRVVLKPTPAGTLYELENYVRATERIKRELEENPEKYGFIGRYPAAERRAHRDLKLKLQIARAQVQAQKQREAGSVAEIEREVASLKNLLGELKKARK